MYSRKETFLFSFKIMYFLALNVYFLCQDTCTCLIFKNPSESTDQCTPIQPPPPISAKTHAIPGACVHFFMLIVWREKIEKQRNLQKNVKAIFDAIKMCF